MDEDKQKIWNKDIPHIINKEQALVKVSYAFDEKAKIQ
jgi:hypothetical protein